MAIVTGDRYLESLVKFVEEQVGQLIEGSLVLKLNPVGLHYVHSRLEALAELESLLCGAPVDYLRAYVSDLGDHRALEQLRRILRLLTSLKVVSVLPPPARDPTPLSLLPFGRLKVLELRGCNLSTSAARGLLELRLTLEKLICHNSTDALRHVFASRIAEIKESPQWNRLSFVSCACNGLVLMDESLQLLPVVENLDLSRNKFSKVDNLRKCTKLRQLDLGFNHLRTMSSFSEVALQVVKLVLRNNALTTLRGIENLKFLEALDLSYNIISNLAELEIVAGLPSLQSFWLEGNPLCCTQWYRAQVFSFFPHPYKLKLDDKHMSTRESWRRIIIASWQKRPASFGLYSPAKDGAEFEGSINIKRKKLSRLASIETEELSTAINSDQESVTCDNEIRNKEENAMSAEEAEINDLTHRIEYMKKERSIQWLHEFKEWISNPHDILIDNSRYSDLMAYPEKEDYYDNMIRHKHQGETSRYISDSIQPSGDESGTNCLDSENSFEDTCVSGCDSQYFDRVAEVASKLYKGHSVRDSLPSSERMNSEGRMKTYYNETSQNIKVRNSFTDLSVAGCDRMGGKDISIYFTAIDDIMESRPSSACPGSPPHYQEDILHRRQNLEEEFLQLSAESLSMVSSDSDTSNSEDDSAEVGPFMPQEGLPLVKLSERSTYDFSSMPDSGFTYHDGKNEISRLVQNGRRSIESGTRQPSAALAQLDGNTLSVEDGKIIHSIKREEDWLQKKNFKRRRKTRLVSLSEEDSTQTDTEHSQNLNEKLNAYKGVIEGKQVYMDGNLQNPVAKRYTWKGAITASFINDGATVISKCKSSSSGRDDFIENYFNSNLADCGVNETCRQYIFCNFMLEQESGGVESEGAILLSSENKIYVILIGNTYDGSGTSLKLVGSYRVEDVKEVLVGLGLQIVRLIIKRDTTYLFITRSMEKSRQLLSTLGFSDSYVTKNNISVRSMEQVQVKLLEKNVCGGTKRGIFQYAMVLFWHNNLEEDLWLSRSLFVLEEQLFMFIEDFMQFGSFSDNASPLSYFVLDSCCSIVDVCEMVIEATGIRCVTLALECAVPNVYPEDMDKVECNALTVEKSVSSRLIWKIKWFSKESLFNFVVLLKTFHDAAAESPLVVRCTS